ncbi:DUF202 domain-containing protein [Romboutsia lituseburensis]|uniref:Putative membrane protein n=1 Tax=Romboutsia lituseburensis DSM 797 TaxID=1121325 RepID=A0A1G9MUH7_9FIRM|nr:DUF202 domain-containing protein [Romboutsia lituseburensis]CEH34310.1 Domain of unknown function (DUF202) [Romboutsia lituseburensis]SDL77900.1 putative membrane protein [Romboutsia lituseburensis DSM 797]
MKYENYKNNHKDMTLRDYLAIDRTILANERTHLSYTRTVVSFLVAALTLYKLLGGIEGIIVALVLIISAIYFLVRGRKTYKDVSENLNLLNISTDDDQNNK